MRRFLLFLLGVVFTALLSAQTSSTFFSTFDAERGNVLTPASGGSLWLGGMKNGRVLLTKLSTDGKALSKHSIDFEGLDFDNENLVDLLEETDGTLVGCGNFESDAQGRGFVFRYDPAVKQVLWAHIVRSGGLNYLFGITQLGPGGDYVLYGNPHFAGGGDAELLRLSRATGQIVAGQAKRLSVGPSDNITQAVYHNGALYTCGRFTGTEPFPDARMRNAICKIDPTTLEPLWTRLGPLPTSSSGRFYGRDLVIDNGAILSTFSGDHTGPVLSKSEVYLQKNDLDGTPLWIRQYKLPAFKGEFAEEIISLPDGYMLYGYDFLTDTSRLFLLKIDKEGEVITAAKIDFGRNDEFPKIPARSKILRVGDALFLTALSENNLGQTQGILIKTDLNGWLGDSCGFVKKTPATFATWEPNVSQLLVPTVTPSPATTEAATTSLSTPSLTFSRKCGVADMTCAALPDLRLTLDSISCANGEPLLHYTFCNVGGQTYEGSAFFGLYDKNPLTEQAKLVTVIIHTGNALAPGERISDVVASNSLPPMSFLLDTFSVLYGLMGINLATTTPVMLSSFPFSPNSPECDYANNLDSFEVKTPICAPDSCHPNTFWKIFGRQGNWNNISALRAAPDGNLYMAGRKDDRLAIYKMAPDGQFLWTRSMAFAPLQRMLIEEIIVDSEGMIVGSGNLADASTAVDKGVFAFRYNPTTDQVLWAQRFTAFRSTEGGILEKTPGGNFLLHYNMTTMPGQIGAEILELDRTTGQIVPAFAKRYEYQYSQAFSNVVAHNGAIYTTGYTIRQVGNTGFRRMVLSKLDASTGNVIWSRTGLTDWPQNSDFAGGDLIVDDNSLLALYYGSETGNAVGNAIKLYLQKTTLDGEVLWVKKYDLAAFPKELVATPDGYIIFGSTPFSTFLKTDKEGNLLISKKLNIQSYFVAAAGTDEQNQAERIGQHLYFAHETARSNQIYGYTTLLKTDLNLEMEFDCGLSPFPITCSSVAVQPNIEAPQTVTASPSVREAVVTTLSPDVIVVHKSCPTCATESCTDLPDITAHVDSITCSPTQGAVARIRVCNLGQAMPGAGFHLTFYGKNPLAGNAVRLQSVFLQEMPAPGQCLQTVLPLNALLLQNPKVYTLAGVDGNVQPPIALDVFPFVNGYTECDYANNLDSFEVKLPDPKKLDLGPDRHICTGQTVTLDAGSGYVLYNWSTGPNSQTYTADATGNFALEVIDACGRKQRDTVRVTVFPYPKRTVEVVVLPGDSVVISGKTYFGTTTVLDTVPTLTGVCDTAVTYQIRLDSLHCPKAASFFKTYKGGLGRVVWPAADGGYYIGGELNQAAAAVGQTLVKLDAAGKILWTRSFDFFQNMAFDALIEDSEGKLVALATSTTGPSNIAVFRYDPAADQVLWIKRMTPPQTDIFAFDLFEKSPGGDYLVAYRLRKNNTELSTEICSLHRTTGNLVGGEVWHYEPHAWVNSVALHQNALYANGLLRDPADPGVTYRYGLMKIDLNTGQPLWARLTTAVQPGLDLGSGDVLVDGAGDVVSTVSELGKAIGLQKTAPNGDLVWLKRLQINEPLASNFIPKSIVLLNDGYLISADPLFNGASINALFFIKTNFNGDLVWAKKLSKAGAGYTSGSPNLLAVRAGNGCFIANVIQQGFQFAGMALGQMDADGNLGTGCALMENVPVSVSNQAATQDPALVVFSTLSRTFAPLMPTASKAAQLLPTTICTKCLPPCEDVAVEKTIQFYPGDTITIDGKAYTQSGTVVQNFTTPAGCDSVATNILQLIITEVKITCPNNLTVTLPPNQTTTVVDYNLPTVMTNCPDSTVKLTLLQGLSVGGNFPQGTTQVCYEAANQCGIRDTCCFTLTAQLPDSPCDVKAPTGCIRYELLNIRLDALGQRRYRVRMTNTCASPLEFAYIQLPNGVLAVSPQQGATYTAPGTNTYAVRNPNASPFYSVRYKAVTGNLNNGKNDVFEYALPQQSAPAYIRVAARLADGTYSEAHLNTYNCPVLPYQGAENRGADGSPGSGLPGHLSVWPNPTEGTLFVRFDNFSKVVKSAPVHLQVLNAQGQTLVSQQVWAENGQFKLDLPAELASGLYYLRVVEVSGQRPSPAAAAARFVLER